MAFPLVTSFAVAGVTRPALLLAVGVAAAFLAHEPLLVLLGRRGPRARRAQRRRAVAWLVFSSATAAGAGLVAVWSVPLAIRYWCLLPLLPAAFLAEAITVEREKSLPAEVAVALAFSLAAVPVGLAAGASTRAALAVGIAFASIFVSGTLAVRVIVLEVRGGGDPRKAWATRVTLLVSAAAAGLGLVGAAWQGLLPWTAPLATAPGLASAGWLAAFPPAPTRLRAVGWTLVAAAAAAALILVAGLAGGP